MQNVDGKSIVKRLKNYMGVKTDKELASRLGLNANTINVWKHRNALDLDSILVCTPVISLDWLIYGVGNKNRINENNAIEQELEINESDTESHSDIEILAKYARKVAMKTGLKVYIKIK